MADLETLNSEIDNDITNKVDRYSISATLLGNKLKSIVQFANGLANALSAAKVDKTTTVNGLPLSGNITLNKSHLGLSNVNNTSDSAKPVSIATAAAIAAAQLGVVHLAGGYNAATGTFPTAGTGNSGSVRAGDTFRITNGGTISGVVYSINDELMALVDNPGQNIANWFKPPYNSNQATEQTIGLSRRATETEAVDGTEPLAYCSPYLVSKAISHALSNFEVPTVAVPLEYSAQLYQFGSQAPNPQAPQIDTISNEVYDDNGNILPNYRAISFSRVGVGTYNLNLWYKTAGFINSSKVAVLFGDSTARITGKANGGNGNLYFTQYTFKTYTPEGVVSDSVLQGNNGTFINLKIYP